MKFPSAPAMTNQFSGRRFVMGAIRLYLSNGKGISAYVMYMPPGPEDEVRRHRLR